MILIRKIYLFLFLIFFSCHLHAQTKVAVIADKGLENYADLLTVELSKQKDLVVIERTEIDRILKEQNLSAISSNNPDLMLSLGRIISADIFVFIEKQDDESFKISFVEVKTAVLLQRRLMSEKESGEGDCSGFDKALGKALKKFDQPETNRAYLCISGIFNEEPGNFLKPYAAEVEDIIQNGLDDIDNIILLDRKHAEFLSKETVLTGEELKLKASAVMLRGGIRRTGNGKLNMTVEFSKMLASGSIKRSIEFDLGKIKESKENINKLILDGSKEAVKSSSVQDKKTEAEKLFTESKVFAIDRNFLKSAELSEFAFLLDPKDEYIKAAISGWEAVFSDRSMSVTTKLRAAIRKKELEILRLDNAIKSGDRLPNIDNVSFSSLQGNEKGGHVYEYFITIQDDPAKGQRDYELVCELKGLTLGEASIGRNYFFDMIKAGKTNSKYYSVEYASKYFCDSIISTVACLGDFIDNEEIVKEMVIKFEDISFSEKIPLGLQNYFADEIYRFIFYENERNIKFGWKQRTEKIKELLMWFTVRKNPLLRAKAWHLLGQLKLCPNAECQRKSISIVMDEVFPEPQDGYQYCIVDSYFNPSREMDLNDLNIILTSRIEKCISENDAYHLSVFRVLVSSWLDQMCYTLKKDDLAAPINLSSRILSVLYSQRNKLKDKKNADSYNYSINLEAIIKPVEHYNNEMKLKAGTVVKEATAPTSWDSFLIEKIAVITKPVNGYRIEGMKLANNCVYCIWSGNEKDKIYYIIVTKTDLKTLKTAEIGRLEGPKIYKDDITSIVICEADTVFVPTNSGLVEISKTGSELFTEAKGLPSKYIGAMAEMNGKLYLGLICGYKTGAFYSYDIKNNRYDLIASTKNADPKNELDGKPFWITRIIPEKDGRFIWFSVNSDKESKLGGLWKLHEDGKLEKAYSCKCGISDFYFISDGIITYEDFGGYEKTIKVSMPSLSKTILMSLDKGDNPKFNFSVWGRPLFIGDLILREQGAILAISNVNNEHFDGPAGNFLTMAEPNLFYFIKDNQLWKISPKTDMGK